MYHVNDSFDTAELQLGVLHTLLYLIIFFGEKGKEHDIKKYAFYAVSMWNTTFVRLRLVGGWKSEGIEKI